MSRRPICVLTAACLTIFCAALALNETHASDAGVRVDEHAVWVAGCRFGASLGGARAEVERMCELGFLLWQKEAEKRERETRQ